MVNFMFREFYLNIFFLQKTPLGQVSQHTSLVSRTPGVGRADLPGTGVLEAMLTPPVPARFS